MNFIYKRVISSHEQYINIRDFFAACIRKVSAMITDELKTAFAGACIFSA
jgi:hypothetical protein